MATKKRRKKKTELQSKKWIVIILSAAFVMLSLVLGPERMDEILDYLYDRTGMQVVSTQVEGDLKVHYIDVGQGDCTLIQTENYNVLIDAGERGNEETVISYLQAQNVKRLDLVIATHMHSDHIGSMASVLSSFDVGDIWFSPLEDSMIPTTRTYEKLLETIEIKGYPVTETKPEMTYDLGNNIELTVLGPTNKETGDLNNTSIVCRVVYDNTSFLFTGDAERKSEEEMMKYWNYEQLKTDVLKLGHHGSRTSNSRAWLEAVRPTLAIAPMGADNDYGHPHPEVVERLNKLGITLYRSDLNGNVVVGSDGEKLSISLQKEVA